MHKIRNIFVVLGMLFSTAAYSEVQVNIGINLSSFPELVVVPDSPVYYAPSLGANFFFYDGLYWVYQDDNWYASSWYNGPWWFVVPEAVPLYVLRIPVRYYRQPPTFFLGWRSDAPPRWGDRWGHEWEQRHNGWDRWNHKAVPAAAPLPRYQQHYSGDNYPRQVEQQRNLQQQNYRYKPRDPEVRQRVQEQAAPSAPAQRDRQRAPDGRGIKQQDFPRGQPTNQDIPRPQQQGRVELNGQKVQPDLGMDKHEQAGQSVQIQQPKPQATEPTARPQPRTPQQSEAIRMQPQVQEHRQ